MSQYDKNSAYPMSGLGPRVLEHRNIWNVVLLKLFEKMTTEPIRVECKYIHVKLKTWKKRIIANFHVQDYQYSMSCTATAVLKIDSL